MEVQIQGSSCHGDPRREAKLRRLLVVGRREGAGEHRNAPMSACWGERKDFELA